MKTLQTTAFIILILLIGSCNKDNTDPPPPPETIDLSSYVAMGNSLTAGYADGALYTSGQEYSYANIIAEQFSKVGGNGIFKTPIIPTEDGVFPTSNQSGIYLETKFVWANKQNCNEVNEWVPVRLVENPNQEKLMDELMTNISSDGPFNNLGVPGITVTHMHLPGMGALNPYYGRFANNPSSDKLIDEAKKVDPTFFSLWVGNNDVLGYASSGGTTSITTTQLFEISYDAAAAHLSSITEGGVLANIPDVASAAFFTTIDYNFVNVETETEVEELQAFYVDYNQQMEALGKDYRINWSLGNNPMVIRDKDMDVSEELKIRQMTESELALLTIPLDSIYCGGWGATKPLSDSYVLSDSEIELTIAAVATFNEIITIAAEKYDLAFVDFNTLMQEVANGGITEDGIEFTTDFAFGNLFSLDGIHLTPRGNALVANNFIEAINAKYSLSVPKAIITDYPDNSKPTN